MIWRDGGGCEKVVEGYYKGKRLYFLERSDFLNLPLNFFSQAKPDTYSDVPFSDFIKYKSVFLNTTLQGAQLITCLQKNGRGLVEYNHCPQTSLWNSGCFHILSWSYFNYSYVWLVHFNKREAILFYQLVIKLVYQQGK